MNIFPTEPLTYFYKKLSFSQSILTISAFTICTRKVCTRISTVTSSARLGKIRVGWPPQCRWGALEFITFNL